MLVCLPTCSVPLARNRVVVIIWSYITVNGVGNISFVDGGNINAKKYEEILEDNLWPIIAQFCPLTVFLAA